MPVQWCMELVLSRVHEVLQPDEETGQGEWAGKDQAWDLGELRGVVKSKWSLPSSSNPNFFFLELRKAGLKKRVAFLLEPGKVKAPELAWDFEVLYCWCPRRGQIDEATSERHNCMHMVGGVGWEHCKTQKGLIGEFGKEAYVLSAGGQPIEKWRCWMHVRFGHREASTVWQLLWCTPFSNSRSHDFPVVLRGLSAIRSYSPVEGRIVGVTYNLGVCQSYSQHHYCPCMPNLSQQAEVCFNYIQLQVQPKAQLLWLQLADPAVLRVGVSWMRARKWIHLGLRSR